MKRIFAFIILLLLVSFKNANKYYQTACVTLETNGYLTLKIWNTKRGQKYKSDEARKEAVHAFLFSGIAGTNGCVTQQAILDQEEEIEKFEKVEKEFFSSKGKWAQFTRSSTTESSLPENLGAQNWKVYQVSVSKDALQKYLEEKSIIKSLKSAF
jgi:hypothetical protein